MGGAPESASARASSGSSSDQQAPRLSLAHTPHDGFSRSRGMAGGTRKVPTAGDEQTASGSRSVRRFIVPSEVTGFLARFFQIPCAWKRQIPYPEFSGSALNMLCTPYTREIRDFMNPRAIRVVPSLRSGHYKRGGPRVHEIPYSPRT